jgi:hypothetical protein
VDPHPGFVADEGLLQMKAFVRPLVLATLFVAGSAAPGHAQIAEFLQAVNRGGGWISLDVVDGRGTYESATVPTGGLRVKGCFQVWEGHSGTWHVLAADAAGDGELDVRTRPGQPVEFDYKAGMQARLEVNVEWSEPRDTTLFMWVGIEGLSSRDRDVCQPA